MVHVSKDCSCCRNTNQPRWSVHTLESKLILQYTIESLAVLATIRPIDPVVRAHERSHTTLDSVLEGPKIEFMHGAIVNVARDSLDRLASRPVDTWIALRLLLVADVMLGAGLDTRGLHPLDRLGEELTSEERVWRETFPSTTSISGTAEWPCDWSKCDMGSFAFELLSHVYTSCASQILVPTGCDAQTCWENRGVGCFSNGERSILQAQAIKSKSVDGTNVTDARTWCASH